MTEIIKMAAELGKLIKKDEAAQKLFAAKDAYEHDEQLNRLLTEYNVQQQALTMEYAKANPDQDFVGAIDKRIRELMEEITAHPLFIAYQDAEREYSDFMQLVNDEINFQITGKRSCSGNCSSCSGCSSEV